MRRYLIALLLCAAGAAPIDRETPKLDLLLDGGGGLLHLSVFEFDGCQYILGQHGPADTVVTHKGNCKYCLERQRRAGEGR